MGPSTKLQPNAVRKIPRSQSASSSEHVGRVASLPQQRSSAGHCVQSHLISRSGSHLFKVASFATLQSVPFLAARARGQVQDFQAHLGALKCMLEHYENQRVNAPRGKTTPEVQPEDWKLAQEIVNTLGTFPEFATLSPALRHTIETLKPRLGQPGQARYSAWTAVGRAFKSSRHAGNRALSARPPAPLQRQVSAPGAAPQRKATVSCQAACQELARLRDGIQTVNGRQQIEWKAIRAHVNAIVASDDFETRFTPQQQSAFKSLQELNGTDAGRPKRFDTWKTVQALLPRDTRPPSTLPAFRVLLNRLTSGGAWMTNDTDALIALCKAERFKPEVWGKDLSYGMWMVQVALEGNGATNAGQLMGELLAGLNQKFPPA